MSFKNSSYNFNGDILCSVFAFVAFVGSAVNSGSVAGFGVD